jgi:signal transduction histidine kinase
LLKGITTVQRALLVFAAALTLPTVILFAVALTLALTLQSERLEARAAEAVQHTLADIDTQLLSDRNALRVLTTANALRSGDLVSFRARAAQAVDLLPGWKGVLVMQGDGDVLMDTTAAAPTRRPHLQPTASVWRDGAPCPCIAIAEPIPGRRGQYLVALTDPGQFQGLLMKEIEPGQVAAIVDRQGLFAARSIDYAARVGKLATVYVRRAVDHGGSGTYEGVTYEGLVNYSAYRVSPETGWSVHVAVKRNVLDSPRLWRFVAIVGGAFLSLLAAGVLIAWAIRDIALRRREAQMMFDRQRTEAIGQFASTVAHDFNNLLTVVLVNLERIESRAESAPIKQAATHGLEAARRGSRLVNQLLAFARDGGAELTVVDVAAAALGMTDLLRQSAGGGVQLEVSTGPEPLPVTLNLDQFEVALVNLVINARDAMNGSGAITVRAEADGTEAVLTVTDTGPGVDEAIRDRLFEAFFTTRADQQGTGLGLSQVAGMAHQARGSVTVRNRPSGGAVFEIRLPLEHEAAPRPDDASV